LLFISVDAEISSKSSALKAMRLARNTAATRTDR
jgi:hypothetical protein